MGDNKDELQRFQQIKMFITVVEKLRLTYLVPNGRVTRLNIVLEKI